MKKLAMKMGLFGLLLAASLSLLIAAPLPANNGFQLLTAKHRILGHTKGKKIILVGGSGIFHSLSAKLLEREFCDYRVVNMGFSAGLGLQFNLNEVKPFLGRGDLVVISPEYGNFEGEYAGQGAILLMAINMSKRNSDSIDRGQFWALVRSDGVNFLSVKAQEYLDALVDSVTGRTQKINENGDFASKNASRDVSRVPFHLRTDAASYDRCVRLMGEFQTYCKSRGALAVLTFPAIPRPQYEAGREPIELLYRKLIRDAPVLILHPPEETVYDPEYFMDTIYHLNERGRGKRTVYTTGLLRGLFARLP